jgi:hypothetical protein
MPTWGWRKKLGSKGMVKQSTETYEKCMFKVFGPLPALKFMKCELTSESLNASGFEMPRAGYINTQYAINLPPQPKRDS